MANATPTHTLSYKKESESGYNTQTVCGVTELLDCISAILADGFTELKISTLKK